MACHLLNTADVLLPTKSLFSTLLKSFSQHHYVDFSWWLPIWNLPQWSGTITHFCCRYPDGHPLPHLYTHTCTYRSLLLKTTATLPLIYLVQTWILLAWKAWGGGCSLSGKSATCWRYSVISVSLKSAHRTQLLFWLSMGPEQKLAKSGFVTDSSQNEPSQFPHRSQGTQGTARDCHLPQVRYVSFPSSVKTWKCFTTSKSS